FGGILKPARETLKKRIRRIVTPPPPPAPLASIIIDVEGRSVGLTPIEIDNHSNKRLKAVTSNAQNRNPRERNTEAKASQSPKEDPLEYSVNEKSASVAYNVNPVADQFQRAFQTSTFCNRLYSFFNKRWFFDQVLNDFLVRSFLRFGYEVSFEALDKGAIEILGPYGISYTFRRLAERISQLQSGFVVRRVRYDPWPPAWSGGVLRCGSFVLPSLNYLLNIEFARYKISTNWDHKADWANGKGGVSRSAIDYRQTFPELQPSLSIQDTNNYLYHNHWHMRYAGEFSEQAIALENEGGKKPQLDDSKPGLTSGKRALPIHVQVRSVSSEKTNKRTRPEGEWTQV
ncbi:hypothetical protein RYX36_031505, partial [Vicia faba]